MHGNVCGIHAAPGADLERVHYEVEEGETVIKGAKSIAEYAIRKWMEQEGFAIECFHAEMTGQHEALVRDCNGDSLAPGL